MESTPLAHFAVEPYLATVKLNQRTGNIQSETRAVCFRPSGALGPEESPEYHISVLGPDTRAHIFNRYLEEAILIGRG